MTPQQHKAQCLNKVDQIFTDAAEIIAALAPGEKVAATELARLVGLKHGLTVPQIYPTLLFLIPDYPQIQIKKGKAGGLYKLP